MKPTLLMTALALLFSRSGAAQVPAVSKALPKVSAGVKFGANYEELAGSSVFDKAYNSGYAGGAFVALTKKKIGVQAEALISSAKIYYNFPAGYSPGPIMLPKSTNLLYFNVPILFEYKLVSHLWLQAGPQVSNLLTAKNNLGYNIISIFKNPEVGAVLGIQATLPLRFNISARYIYGLTNLNNTIESGTWNTRSIQITGGYRIL